MAGAGLSKLLDGSRQLTALSLLSLLATAVNSIGLAGFNRRQSMARSNIAKGQRRTEGGTTGPVSWTTHGGDTVTRSVEPGNRLPPRINHLAMFINLRTTLGIQRTGRQDNRVIGSTLSQRVHGHVRILVGRLVGAKKMKKLVE